MVERDAMVSCNHVSPGVMTASNDLIISVATVYCCECAVVIVATVNDIVAVVETPVVLGPVILLSFFHVLRLLKKRTIRVEAVSIDEEFSSITILGHVRALLDPVVPGSADG